MPITRNRPFRRLLDVRRLFGLRRAIDDELSFHIAHKAEDLIADGWSPAQARAEAARRFGDLGAVTDQCRRIGRRSERQSRLRATVDAARQNLALGLRQLRRSPSTTAAALISLIAGIGAATALYSVAHATLMRPLPFPAADRLVRLGATNPELADMQASEPDFLDWRAQATSLDDAAGIGYLGLALTDREPPLQLDVAAVSASFFSVIGTPPVLGRAFTAEEDRPGGPTDVAILGHGLFASRYGADPAILGRRLELDGRSLTVVGVMPEGFAFPQWADLWVPLAPDPASQRDDHEIDVIARLTAGVTPEQAQADLDRVATDIAAAHPVTNQDWGVRLTSFDDWLIGPRFASALYVLLGAVGLLVVLACVNVANLLIARGMTRTRELSLRAALGAGRRRLVGQLLTEGALLAVLGGIGGVLLASLLVGLLQRLEPAWLPRWEEVRINAAVLFFALVASLATGLLFALLPALQATRGDLARSLASGGRTLAAGDRRLRAVLVATEVAVATVLLVGAGLLFDTFVRLTGVETGFDARSVLVGRMQLPTHRYDWRDRADLLPRIEQALATVPGVRRVGLSNGAPFGGFRPVNTLRVVGSEDASFLLSDWRSVSPGYFVVAGIPIVRGRGFAPADRGDGEGVAIISQAMAEALWPDGDAVDGLIDWGSPGGDPLRVVGIAGDVRDVDLEETRWTLYRPYAQIPWAAVDLMLKTDRPAALIAPEIARAIWSIDPNLAIPQIQPLAKNVEDATARQRSTMILLVAFAAVALVIAASGVYGLTLFGVRRRRRELGIRLAVGARPAGLVAMLLGSSLRLALIGALIGGAASLAARHLVASLLFEAPGMPWGVLGTASLVLLTATGLACYLPARQAARLDPTTVLRSE